MSGALWNARGLSVGAPTIVRGGAEVALFCAEPAVAAPPEAPGGLSEEEAAKAGFFQPRLIEFGETREETLVSVLPFVREELVVARSVERRDERIEERVRRTEVEVEDLASRENGA